MSPPGDSPTGPGRDETGPDETGPDGAGPGPARRPPYVEEALAAHARVVAEDGRWVVLLDVVLASGGVTRRVGDYPDERRAAQAARIIERNAIRFIPVAGQESAGPGWFDRP